MVKYHMQDHCGHVCHSSCFCDRWLFHILSTGACTTHRSKEQLFFTCTQYIIILILQQHSFILFPGGGGGGGGGGQQFDSKFLCTIYCLSKINSSDEYGQSRIKQDVERIIGQLKSTVKSYCTFYQYYRNYYSSKLQLFIAMLTVLIINIYA